MASLAEEESRGISNNIRWSVRKRFEQGKVIINTTNFLGYTKDENGKLTIIPEEAITVRRIYKDFMDGLPLQHIAEGLTADNIPTPSGRKIWSTSTVKSILQNEKYKGDSLLQKTYLADFLSPRRIKNEGQAQNYYVEDSHPAIITKEMFDAVQSEFERRGTLRGAGENGNGRYSGKYTFSGMIACGECGEVYRRHQQYNRYKKYYIWVCKQHENKGKSYCNAKPIKENKIKQAFLKAINELIIDKDALMAKVQRALELTVSDDIGRKQIENDTKISKLQKEIVRLTREQRLGEGDSQEIKNQIREVSREIDDLSILSEEMNRESGELRLVEYRLNDISKILTDGKIFEEFEDTIFKSLVKSMRVTQERMLVIEFYSGLVSQQQI